MPSTTFEAMNAYTAGDKRTVDQAHAVHLAAALLHRYGGVPHDNYIWAAIAVGAAWGLFPRKVWNTKALTRFHTLVKDLCHLLAA